MSDDLVFDDTVKICELYADPYERFEVDRENNTIVMGEYTIDPLMEKGYLTEFLVSRSDGKSYLVWDLDEFFKREFDWRELL